MTRAEAISRIMGVWATLSCERCVGVAEYEQEEIEMHNALRALGVTEEEMQ